jgi:hypothetical protein
MSKPVSIHIRRERIKLLGEQLGIRQLSNEDTEFLSDALIRIGNGEDPATALDVGGRRGESNKEKARQAAERKELVKFTIDALRAKGERVESIVGRLGENGSYLFVLTEKTLEQYYYDKDD